MTTAAPRAGAPSRALWARWHGGLEILLFVILSFVYEALRDLVAPDAAGIARAVGNAADIVAVERALGLHIEGGIQDATHAVPGGEFFTTWFYTLAHAPGYVVFFAALWFFRRAWYPFVRNWFWIGHGVAVLVFWLYPLAPPRLASLGLEDTTKQALELGGALSWFQPFRNEFAAMPSLHMGYTFFFAFVGYLLLRGNRWRGLIWLWPVVMSWVTIATANHYWLDGVGGIAVMGAAGLVAAWALTRDMPRPWDYRRSPAPPATVDPVPAARA
jgi:hypothetical protein